MTKKIPRRSKYCAMRAKAASQAKEHPDAKKTAEEVAPPPQQSVAQKQEGIYSRLSA